MVNLFSSKLLKDLVVLPLSN